MASQNIDAAVGTPVSNVLNKRQSVDLLPPEAHPLLRPVVESGTGFYILIGVLVGFIGLGLAAYLAQLRYGLGVTGMGNYFSWGIYITNFVFFIGVSHAGTLVSAILRVSGADWRQPITRMAEVITGVALLIGAPMVLIDLGRIDRIYNLVIHGRLQSPLLWDVFSVTTYLVGSIVFLYLPLIPDLARCYPHLKDRYPIRARIYKVLSLGWQGTPEQYHLLERAMAIMAVVIIPVAISVHTVVSFIFSMTIREGWHSTIFGPYFVIGAIYSGLAAIIVAMWLFTKYYKLEKYITPLHFRRVGYLLLAAGLIYLYMTFAEYLTMFYGSEEAGAHLFQSLFVGQYSKLFLTAVTLSFAPLFIVALGRWTGIKAMVIGSVVINIGMWLKRYIIVTPTLANPILPIQNVAERHAAYWPTWVELSITAAALAGFILLYVLFTKLFPIISIWEVEEQAERSEGQNG